MTIKAIATAININVMFRSVFLCRCLLRVDAEPAAVSVFTPVVDVTARCIDVLCRACNRYTIRMLSTPRKKNGTAKKTKEK